MTHGFKWSLLTGTETRHDPWVELEFVHSETPITTDINNMSFVVIINNCKRAELNDLFLFGMFTTLSNCSTFFVTLNER
jgi:hypothetical protein